MYCVVSIEGFEGLKYVLFYYRRVMGHAPALRLPRAVHVLRDLCGCEGPQISTILINFKRERKSDTLLHTGQKRMRLYQKKTGARHD